MIQYEILDILEFTSDRKRMSVVVKDLQNGVILLLTKGADEVILPYASHGKLNSLYFLYILFFTIVLFLIGFFYM